MASWELSPLYRHASSVLLPDSHRLVSIHKDRVVLRNIQTLQVLRTWALPLPASAPTRSSGDPGPSLNLNLTVSPCAPFLILVAALKHRTAWVIHPDHEGLHARLDVGNEGAVAVEWAHLGPEGEPVVLSWSAHHLRLSLFRLADPGNALSIVNPKHSHPHGYSFRPDGAFLAVLERHHSRDVIGIYSTSAWSLMRTIPLQDPNSDLADVAWSPCGRYLAAWSAVTDYTLHVFTPDGRLLSTFSPYSSLSPPPAPTASSRASRKPAAPAPPPQPPQLGAHDLSRRERSTAPYVGLGIRTVAWAPGGEWLAVGGWDGKVRVLSRAGRWAVVAEVGLPARVVEPVVAWREPAGWVEKTRGKGIVSFDSLPLPHSLTPLAPNFAAPVPKIGIAKLLWSSSGRWIAAWDAAHPHLVAIYTFPLSSDVAPSPASRPRLHTLLVHSAAPASASPGASAGAGSGGGVRALAWQPAGARRGSEEEDGEGSDEETLVMLVGEKKGLTLWRSTGDGAGVAECVGIPAPADVAFPASSLSFAPDGRSLLLSAPAGPGAAAGEETFCVAYPVYDYDEMREAEEDGAGERTRLSEDGLVADGIDLGA